jgi:hypothetical protein
MKLFTAIFLFIILAAVFQPRAQSTPAPAPFFRMLEDEFYGPFKADVLSVYPRAPHLGTVLLHRGYCLAFANHGFLVLDNRSVTNLTLVGQFHRPEYGSAAIRSIQIEGDRLYWGIRWNIEVYDISTPTDPIRLATLTNYFRSEYTQFIVRDSKLFYLDGPKLLISDLTNLGEPRTISETEVTLPHSSMEIDPANGDKLLLSQVNFEQTSQISLLALYDISNLAAPRLLSEHQENIGNPAGFGVTLANSSVVSVLGGTNRILLVELLGEDKSTFRQSFAPSENPRAHGTNVFAPSTSGTVVFAITPEGQLRRVSTIGSGLLTGRFDWDGDRLAQFESGPSTDFRLAIYDISNLSQPVRRATWRIPPNPFSGVGLLTVTNQVVHLTSGEMIDFGNRAAPRYLESSGPLPAILHGSGGYRLNGSRLEAIEFRTPTQRRVVNQISLPSRPAGFFIAGNRLFVGLENKAEIYSLADPLLPVKVGEIEYPTGLPWVYVEGDRKFELMGSGLRMRDISDPANVRELGSIPVVPGSYFIRALGNYLYLGSVIFGPNNANLFTTTIVDVTDGNLKVVKELEVTGDVMVRGDYLYLSPMRQAENDMKYLQVYDNRNPANPVLVKEALLFGSMGRPFLEYTMVVHWMVDFSNPADPQPVDILPIFNGFSFLDEETLVTTRQDQAIALKLNRLTDVPPGLALGAPWRAADRDRPANVKQQADGSWRVSGLQVLQAGCYSDQRVTSVFLPPASADAVFALHARVRRELSNAAPSSYSARVTGGSDPRLELARIESGEATLVLSTNFAWRTAEAHKILLEANGDRIVARIFAPGEARFPIARVEFNDMTFRAGYVGIQSDGSESIVMDFAARGVAAAPEIRASLDGLYWMVPAQGRFELETAEGITGPWRPVAAEKVDELIEGYKPAADRQQSFYRLAEVGDN